MEQQEKLVPFDYAAFEAEPARLRRATGGRPDWAEPVRGNVVARWSGIPGPTMYWSDDVHCLRLAAKTRKVKVRLYRTPAGIFALTDDGSNLAGFDYYGHPWAGDIIEVEVTE